MPSLLFCRFTVFPDHVFPNDLIFHDHADEGKQETFEAGPESLFEFQSYCRLSESHEIVLENIALHQGPEICLLLHEIMADRNFKSVKFVKCSLRGVDPPLFVSQIRPALSQYCFAHVSSLTIQGMFHDDVNSL